VVGQTPDFGDYLSLSNICSLHCGIGDGKIPELFWNRHIIQAFADKIGKIYGVF